MITGSTLDHWCHADSDDRRKHPSGDCPYDPAMLSLLIILATPPVLQLISSRSFFRGCLQPSTRAAVASNLRILFIDMPAFDIPISLFSIPIVYLLAIVPHVQKVYLPRHLRLLSFYSPI